MKALMPVSGSALGRRATIGHAFQGPAPSHSKPSCGTNVRTTPRRPGAHFQRKGAKAQKRDAGSLLFYVAPSRLRAFSPKIQLLPGPDGRTGCAEPATLSGQQRVAARGTRGSGPQIIGDDTPLTRKSSLRPLPRLGTEPRPSLRHRHRQSRSDAGAACDPSSRLQ